MSEPSKAHKELMDEIVHRTNMGNKKFHSETSLQKFGNEDENEVKPDEKDPGVLNVEVNTADLQANGRRRTVSQPGPVSGNLITATAARAARKRIPRSVMYSDSMPKQQSPKYLTTSRFPDESESISAYGEQNRSTSPSPYNNYRNADSRSLNSYRLYAPNDQKVASTPRKRSVATMDAQSLRSIDTQAPPSTSPERNKELTIENLTMSLSCIYAILLVTVGIVVFISDPFVDTTKISTAVVYNLILTCIGFIYMLILIIDINRYKSISKENEKIRSRHRENIEEYFMKQELELESATPGDGTPDLKSMAIIPPPELRPLKHDYCFSEGRHSGSFFLKLGAAGFAFGHLVHSLLVIATQIGYIVDENISNDECVDYMAVALDFINPMYCFFQLFFIFKFSNVIILRGQVVARFGFMHFIGSSLCFWLSSIVRETVLALTLYAQSKQINYDNSTNSYNSASSESLKENRIFDVDNLFNENCEGSPAISSIYKNFSPYLYPFSVEFNILIVAVYYIIWTNIGNCDNDSNDEDDNSTTSLSDVNTVSCKIPLASEENNYSSNIVIYADCHASNRGLFVGLIVMVFVIGMLILGFVFNSVGGEFVKYAYILSDYMKLFLHVFMLLAVVIVFNLTKKLDINAHPISLLDDVLLFICLPAFFIEIAFSMVATISILNIVKTIDFVVMFVQVIIQTSLIVDSLRRCSNSRKLRRTKPGREIIMFLIVANVGMWIFNTFSYKSPESLDERYAFYGKELWSVLGHISLPLIMFYRFHSSVCFADIWDSAYKPGSEH